MCFDTFFLMLIFAHRGLGFGGKENSLENFEEVLKSGFSLEIDVQMTKDGILVICHDRNLKRTKGGDILISEAFYDEIKGLVPTFDEFCVLLQGHQRKVSIAIHVKGENERLLTLLSDRITQHRLENKVFLFDLTSNGAKVVKEMNSNIKIALSVGEKRYFHTIFLWDDVKDFKEMDHVWWDEWHSGLYTKENADLIKKENIPIYVVSPELHRHHNHPEGNSLEDIKKVWGKLVQFGVDGICTDYPIELQEFLKTE